MYLTISGEFLYSYAHDLIISFHIRVRRIENDRRCVFSWNPRKTFSFRVCKRRNRIPRIHYYADDDLDGRRWRCQRRRWQKSNWVDSEIPGKMFNLTSASTRSNKIAVIGKGEKRKSKPINLNDSKCRNHLSDRGLDTTVGWRHKQTNNHCVLSNRP